MSIAHFWQQYIEGDNQILGKLYRPVFQKLYFVAFKYTHNEEASFDLVHDIFTSLLDTPIIERENKWKDIKNIEGFLVVLIKCKALDLLKITKNRNRILHEKYIYCEIKDENIENENIEQLYKIIELLSLKEQKLLKLHLSGYKNEEIAKHQNQSEKSIRNRLSESRNKLKLLWKKNYLLILILNWIN